MKQKRVHGFVSIFMIVLIISLPFCAAEAYAASVVITKNQGEDGIKGFIDADGDTWEVEAAISGVSDTVDPKDVKINVEGNEAEFSSCSAGSSETTCKYLSPLTDGILSGVYDFSVIYYYTDSSGAKKTASDSSVIKADGTTLSDGYTPALEITFSSVKQDISSGGLFLDFSVQDKPNSYCSGLKKIEIIDTEKGVLETIDDFTLSDCVYNYKEDSGDFGLLAVKLDGEGKRWIKIKAEDVLGHEKTSSAVSFFSDYVAPKIDTGSLELLDFGTFVGKYESLTDIRVNITENGTLDKVTATSKQADLNNAAASCKKDTKGVGVWNCVWKNVKVMPAGTISLSVTAIDSAGNKETETVSSSFVVDDSEPVADFFGTIRTYEDLSYVSSSSKVKNTILLKISETGSGIDEEGIRASLSGLGKSDYPAPDYFNETTYEARWEVNYAGGSSEITINLYKLDDKTGNSGTLPQINVQVDGSGPTIGKAEVYGSSDTVSKKDYFQSNDEMVVDLVIRESHGLLILVDLNDLVKDAKTDYPGAENVYPESGKDYSGWMIFTEEDCTRAKAEESEETTSEDWECELKIPAIKSGPDSSAELNIEVYDTAGNPASWKDEPQNAEGKEGKYKINILGLDLEEYPDYWEMDTSQGIKVAPSFIDLDTTHLMNTRIAATVPLKSEKAKAKLVSLVSCTAAEGSGNASVGLTRSLLYGGISGTEGKASPTIVLEFETFDAESVFGSELEAAKEKGVFQTAGVLIECKLEIYSEIGKKATKSGEVQDVNFSVDFAYSKLGSLDENIDAMIEEIKDTAAFKIPNALKTVNLVLQWIRHIASVIQVISDVVLIYNAVTVSGESLRTTLIGKPIATALCSGNNVGETAALELPSYIQVPVSILSCNPDPVNLGVYGKFQEGVLNVYNAWSGRGLLGLPAKSLYENFWTSVFGLCVPGILYNLEKLRQVKCRYMLCLKNDVPAGIATVDSCKKMGEYLECRYFWGNLAATAIPLLGAWDAVIGYLKSFASSPIGLIRLGVQLVCLASCAISNTLSGTCTFLGVIVKVFDIIDTVYGAFTAHPGVTGDPYCGALDL